MKLPDSTISLCCLRNGQSACVYCILGPPDDVHRLEEFGLHRGRQIEMFRPGDPCIIRLAGNKVCLRMGDRVEVLVQPVAAIPGRGQQNRRRNGWRG